MEVTSKGIGRDAYCAEMRGWLEVGLGFFACDGGLGYLMTGNHGLGGWLRIDVLMMFLEELCGTGEKVVIVATMKLWT